jgi:hypothetical protein
MVAASFDCRNRTESAKRNAFHATSFHAPLLASALLIKDAEIDKKL